MAELKERPWARSRVGHAQCGRLRTASAARLSWLMVIGVLLTPRPSTVYPSAIDRSGGHYDIPLRFRRLTRRCSSQMQLAAGISPRHSSSPGRRGRKVEMDAGPKRQISRPFPEAMLKWSSHIQGRGRTLVNLGSICYLNSVLQVITHTPPLANYCLGQGHSTRCRRVGFCALCLVESHVRNAFRYPVLPRALHRTLSAALMLHVRQILQSRAFLVSLVVSSILSNSLSPAVLHTPCCAKRGPDEERWGVAIKLPDSCPLGAGFGDERQPQDAHEVWLLLLEAMDVFTEGREGARGDRISTKRDRLDWSRSSAESASRSDSEDGRCAQAEGPGSRARRGGAAMAAHRERTGGIVEALFGGKVRATVTCSGCGGLSTTRERFLDLSVDLAIASPVVRSRFMHAEGSNPGKPRRALAQVPRAPGGGSGAPPAHTSKGSGCVEASPSPRMGSTSKRGVGGAGTYAATVEEALAQYFSVQSLDGGDATFRCAKCSCTTMATRHARLARVPPVLAIHLKRYTGRGAKLHRHVAFPLVLSLSPYLSESSRLKDQCSADSGDTRASQMCLYGVIVHSGESRGGGHYHAYVRDCHGSWWEMSDDSAFKTEEAHVLAQQAYMLFYQRHAEPLRQHNPG